jgi:hypothetical protein
MVKGADSRGNINPQGRDSSGAILINAMSEIRSSRDEHASGKFQRDAENAENIGVFRSI